MNSKEGEYASIEMAHIRYYFITAQICDRMHPLSQRRSRVICGELSIRQARCAVRLNTGVVTRRPTQSIGEWVRLQMALFAATPIVIIAFGERPARHSCTVYDSQPLNRIRMEISWASIKLIFGTYQDIPSRFCFFVTKYMS
jgi:hypothetical protein